MRKPLIILISVLLFCGLAVGVAKATTAAVPTVDAIVEDAPQADAAPDAAPTAAVLDAAPTAAPAAPDDLDGARRYGWAAAAFLLLVIVTRLVAKLPIERLAFLRSGKNAVVVSAVGVVALSAYNALALGGSLVATVFAALTSLLHFIDAGAK